MAIRSGPLSCIKYSLISTQLHLLLLICIALLQIGQAVNKFGSRDIRWSSEGMLRIELTLMKQLFKPTIDKIKEVTFPFFK